MSTKAAEPQATSAASSTPAIVVQSAARGVLGIVISGVLLFVSSGDWRWGMAWAYLGIALGGITASIALLARHDPALLVERSRIRKGTKRWDKALVVPIVLVLPLALLIVAGLDRRFAWSPDIAATGQIAALAAMVLGYAVVVWGMLANTFFAATVRIQAERGHQVISGGPYRYVRHPGYVGAVVADLAMPIALGSLWALIPGGLAAALLVLRTGLEDRTLRRELSGYQDYTGRVRYRLLPGIW